LTENGTFLGLSRLLRWLERVWGNRENEVAPFDDARGEAPRAALTETLKPTSVMRIGDSAFNVRGRWPKRFQVSFESKAEGDEFFNRVNPLLLGSQFKVHSEA
jgi:hypothetical protein